MKFFNKQKHSVNKIDFVVTIIGTEDENKDTKSGDLKVIYRIKSKFFDIDKENYFWISRQYVMSFSTVELKKIIDKKLSEVSTKQYEDLMYERKRKIIKHDILGIRYDETILGIDQL